MHKYIRSEFLQAWANPLKYNSKSLDISRDPLNSPYSVNTHSYQNTINDKTTNPF